MSFQKVVRALALTALCGGLAAAAPVAACASDASIQRTIKAYSPQILETEGRVLTAIGQYKETRKAGPVESALNGAIKVLQSLKAAISGEKARSVKVKDGKDKLETGLGSVVQAYDHLKLEFEPKPTSKGAAKRQAEKADAAVKKGEKQLAEGLKLLKSAAS